MAKLLDFAAGNFPGCPYVALPFFSIFVREQMKRIHLPGRVDLSSYELAILFFAFTMLLPNASLTAQSDAIDSRVASEFGISKGQIVELEFAEIPRQGIVADIVLNGNEYTFELHPNSVRSENFVLKEQLADGTYAVRDPEPPQTVKGALRGSKGSRVAGAMTDEGLAAKIVMGDGQVLYIEPIASKIKGDEFERKHVLYRTADTKPHAGLCGVGNNLQRFESVRMANDQQNRIRRLTGRSGGGTEGGSGDGGGIQVAELGVDADFEYFSDYGTVQATLDRMELIVNIVNNQYEADVEITHVISAAVVRSNANDPYTSFDSLGLLTQFRTEWLNNQQGLQRDVAHLFTGREINGGTIGRAWDIGAICNNNAYCFSQSDFNGVLGCATDLTAHELGHLWNGSHCNCTSHTMNPSITCANQFNPTFTVPSIINYRNTLPCLSSNAPDNDNWEDAIAVGSLPAMVTGTNENATVQVNEQNLGDTGSTVWWTAIAPGNGIMRVSTAGSNFDTLLRIYTGFENGFENLQNVAFDDDANGTLQSEITFPVQSGQRYEIRVGGFTNGGAVAQGDIELNVSFMPQGPTQFFWSDRELNTGAINDSNPGIVVSEGSSGSLYLYYDATASEIDTGAFLDIATTVPGVIEFTVAETLEYDITASGVPFAVRWGDAVGDTGDVSTDFIDELGAVNVVAGTGMLLQNSGPTFLDEGYDASVGAFLFARVDYTVVGAPGSSVEIITAPGMTGIVNNSLLLNPDFGSMKLTVSQDLPPTSDFFWSNVGLDSGAANDSTGVFNFAEGSSGSLYLYYDTMMSEIDTGAFIDIATSTSGVIEFTFAETLEFDITTSGTPFSLRWGDASGPTGDVTADFIDELGALTVLMGTGMLNENTGPIFFDEGYDFDSESFLFARVDFNVIGPEGSSVDILTTRGATGIVHQGMLLDPLFGVATINVGDVLKGDVNCDGIVDLLDVQPFVDLLASGGYSDKADINSDGVLNLVDVQPFINLLTGG